MPKRLFHKHTKKVGSAPGLLVHVGERHLEQVALSELRYDAGQLRELSFAPEQLAEHLPEESAQGVHWLNVDGLHDPAVIEGIGAACQLHLLVQEDILNTAQRPKLEEFDRYLFFVVKMLRLEPDSSIIRSEQVSLVVGQGYLVSFQERHGDVFDGVRERLRSGKGRIRQRGADYLAYALLDAVVDGYYVLLETLGDRIEELEELLVSRPEPEHLQQIHTLKREMILLRKSIWPLRELISSLVRDEHPLVTRETQVFLRDVYDHTIQVVDTVESYRDILGGLQDLYLSSLSNRMNEVMKVLTMIATIFIPLSFLAGLYGMNFEYIPELKWRFGYFILLAVMALLAGGMLVYFRRKKWL